MRSERRFLHHAPLTRDSPCELDDWITSPTTAYQLSVHHLEVTRATHRHQQLVGHFAGHLVGGRRGEAGGGNGKLYRR